MIGNSTRVGIITEPGFMAKSLYEFEELEKWLELLESYWYMVPYQWPKYDLLILPPSFPMGGMENPMLTFASPTVVVGDRSQVYVAAHEIAHSWTGNLVTCADWDNFWLNEGFTVYMERWAQGARLGDDKAKVSSYIGNITAFNSMKEYGFWNSYSSIHPNVGSDLPDNSFSVIPYEKGF